LLFGLRRFVFALGVDSDLGTGKRYTRVNEALRDLEPERVAVALFIHACCRKLLLKGSSRLWRTILEDAVMRAKLGLLLFGSRSGQEASRAALAGFSTRSGLVILLACADDEQGAAAVRMLADSEPLERVGAKVFGTQPRLVSALALLAAGFGRVPALGIAAAMQPGIDRESEMNRWAQRYDLIELLRSGAEMNAEMDGLLSGFGFEEPEAEYRRMREILSGLRREGHGWNWLMGG
jgi:hypothetical protein